MRRSGTALGLAVLLSLGAIACTDVSPSSEPTGTSGPTFLVPASTSTTIDPYGVEAIEASNRVTAVLEAEPRATDAVAANLMAVLEPGRCVDPTTVDLGPLTPTAQWEHVCRGGRPGMSPLWIELDGTGHVPNLTWSTLPPVGPDICYRRLTRDWWNWYSGSHDPEKSCMDGYTFQGA